MKVKNHKASVKVIHSGTEKIIFTWFDDNLKTKVQQLIIGCNAEAYFILYGGVGQLGESPDSKSVQCEVESHHRYNKSSLVLFKKNLAKQVVGKIYL